jgi:molybdopterin-binding protein
MFNFFIIIKLSVDGNSNTRVAVALGTTVVLTEVITAAAVRAFL